LGLTTSYVWGGVLIEIGYKRKKYEKENVDKTSK